jgi:proline iminopeptidase
MKVRIICKRAGLGVSAFVGVFLLAFLGLFVATRGDYSVPATVVDDPGLSQIRLNGVLFYYQVFGEQNEELIVGLHGGPGQDHHYLEGMQELADEYRVVLYDQRGSGLSERVPDEALTMEAFIADLDAFVEHFSLDGTAILIGHSWGAMLAAGYTDVHPEKVSALVLAEPGFLNPEMARRYMKATNNMAVPMTVRNLAHFTRSWFQSLHVKGPDADARDDFFYLMAAFGDPSPDHPLAGYWADPVKAMSEMTIDRFGMRAGTVFRCKYFDEEGNLTYDFTANAAAYDGTVLFISGEDNKLIGPEYQRDQVKLYPRAKLEVIPHAGHSMFNENPAYTFEVIRKYLNQ